VLGTGVRVNRLFALAAAAWVGRWALLELAARVANRIPRRPHAPDPERRPGHMPGPFDRRRRDRPA